MQHNSLSAVDVRGSSNAAVQHGLPEPLLPSCASFSRNSTTVAARSPGSSASSTSPPDEHRLIPLEGDAVCDSPASQPATGHVVDLTNGIRRSGDQARPPGPVAESTRPSWKPPEHLITWTSELTADEAAVQPVVQRGASALLPSSLLPHVGGVGTAANGAEAVAR